MSPSINSPKLISTESEVPPCSLETPSAFRSPPLPVSGSSFSAPSVEYRQLPAALMTQAYFTGRLAGQHLLFTLRLISNVGLESVPSSTVDCWLSRKGTHLGPPRTVDPTMAGSVVVIPAGTHTHLFLCVAIAIHGLTCFRCIWLNIYCGISFWST